MERHSSENTTIVNYLLSNVSDEQREKLEERYFSDDDMFARVLDVEDQLINDYLQGHLTASQHQQFERHYLTLPNRRRKVEMARRLLQVPVPQKVFTLTPQPAGIRAWLYNWRLVSSLVAAAILLTFGFIAWQRLFRPQSSSELVAQPSPSVSSTPTTPAAMIPPVVTGTRVVSLLLSPELLRGNETESSRTAFITPATEQIEISLQVPSGQAAKYRASLEKQDEPGKSILTSDSVLTSSLREGKTVVTWTLKTASLPIDDYEIKLFRIDQNNTEIPLGSYKFQVRQQ